MNHKIAQNLWLTLSSKRHIMASVLPGVALVMLHSTIFELPRSDLIDALDTDHYRFGWIVGAYALGGALGMALTKFISGQLGLRKTYCGALLLFAIASLLAGSAQSVFSMTPARFAEGLGMGATVSSGMIMLWREFPVRRELAMALYGMAMYVPSMAGVVIGGLATTWFTWRLTFWLNLPLALLITPLAWKLLPQDDRQRTPVPFDFVGGALLLVCVVSLNVALDLGQYWGWTNSREFIPWMILAITGWSGFVVWGLLATHPLVHLRPLMRGHFACGLAIKVAFSINLYVLVTMIASYMINLRLYQWWQGALVLSAALATTVLGIVLGIVLGTDANRKVRMFLGLAIMSVATWMLTALDVYTAKTWLAADLALWGWGLGLVVGPALTTTFEGLTFEQALDGAGVFNIGRTLPAFAIGGLLATLLVRHSDENFDWFRLDIQQNRPVVQQALRSASHHAVARGSDRGTADRQAHALLTHWVRANSQAFAFQDAFRALAIVPALGLLAVLAVKIPVDDAK